MKEQLQRRGTRRQQEKSCSASIFTGIFPNIASAFLTVDQRNGSRGELSVYVEFSFVVVLFAQRSHYLLLYTYFTPEDTSDDKLISDISVLIPMKRKVLAHFSSEEILLTFIHSLIHSFIHSHLLNKTPFHSYCLEVDIFLVFCLEEQTFPPHFILFQIKKQTPIPLTLLCFSVHVGLYFSQNNSIFFFFTCPLG